MCCFTRNTLLGVVAVLAAMQLGTAPARSTPVSLESTGAPCSAITPPTSHGPGTGGCAIKLSSTGSVEIGTALSMTLCNHQFEGKIDGNGQGYLYQQSATNCSPISETPCTSPEGGTNRRNWPLEFTSETNMEWYSCIVRFGITINCHLPNVTVTQNATHGVTYTTGASHQFCEGSATNSVQATWTAVINAAHPPVELSD